MTEVANAQQAITSIIQEMEVKGEIIISGRRGEEDGCSPNSVRSKGSYRARVALFPRILLLINRPIYNVVHRRRKISDGLRMKISDQTTPIRPPMADDGGTCRLRKDSISTAQLNEQAYQRGFADGWEKGMIEGENTWHAQTEKKYIRS